MEGNRVTVVFFSGTKSTAPSEAGCRSGKHDDDDDDDDDSWKRQLCRHRRTYEDSFDDVIGRDEDDDGYDGVIGAGSLLAAKARKVDERSGTWRLRDESSAAR